MTEQEKRSNTARQHHANGCNCCQAVVMAYSDTLPIEQEHAMNVAAPFGRGLAGCREVCGCVSAMSIVCGLTGHTAELRELIEQFRATNGDIVCSRLLQSGKRPCRELVAYAASLLATTI